MSGKASRNPMEQGQLFTLPLQVVALPGNSGKSCVPKQLLFCICRNSIYVNNTQIIYVITPRTPIETRSRDLNQQSALVSIPRCIPGQSQGELSHELTEGVGPRALRHLLARRVAPLADKEEALQEEDRLVPAAGLKQGS